MISKIPLSSSDSSFLSVSSSPKTNLSDLSSSLAEDSLLMPFNPEISASTPVCVSRASRSGASVLSSSSIMSPNALSEESVGVLTPVSAATATAVSPSMEFASIASSSSKTASSSSFFLILIGMNKRLEMKAATNASTRISVTWMNLWFASISRDTLNTNAKINGIRTQRNKRKRCTGFLRTMSTTSVMTA